MMMCEKLFEKIDELYETYLDVWEEVCNLESPTRHKAGVDAVGNYFAKMAEKRGCTVEYFEQPVSGNVVCITMNADVQAQPVTFSGHMDTVHAIGKFSIPAVHRDAEKIYGPGVTDCKGGLVASFLAMDALDKIGFKSRPVQLLLQSDEECGSNISNKATIQYICERAKDSVAFLNVEGYREGQACLVRKGIVTFTFNITGKEAHSSECALTGANAILEAAYKIIELEKLKDDDGITCCCSVIGGGTVHNSVPDKCEFKANVRFATQQQLEWMCKYAQEIADKVYVAGCSCTVSRSPIRVAMELKERNVSLLEKMNRIYSENGLPVLEMVKRKGGSDAADVTAYGIPCVDSIGVHGGEIHSVREYAYLKSLKESAKRLAAVAYCI